MLVWIRFPNLNIVYYDESFAMTSIIGRVIEVNNILKVEKKIRKNLC